MKRILIILLILSMGLPLMAHDDNTEFRATWVITWHLISSGETVEQGKARIRNILDNHKEAGMNAVLWHVRQGGTAYFDSNYEPWGRYAGGSYPGFDPLAYAVEEAHKRGMEIHAWFNTFQTSSLVSGAPAYEHPEWVCRDQNGNPMTSDRAISPGMPAVREYTLKVAMEVVNNYDVDGIHFDYVRWNEYSSSKTSQDWAAYVEKNNLPDGVPPQDVIDDLTANKAGRYLYDVDHPYSAGVPSGYSSWEEYWRASVTAFVASVHDSVQIVKPWVRVSAAALGKYNWSGWQGYGSVYQDAALWFNEGYLDQLTPMHYHWTTGAGFLGMLSTDPGMNWEDNIQEGIAAQRIYTVGPGSYILDENNVWNNHPAIVVTCRTLNWTHGFQFFSYGSWLAYDYWAEAGETFFAKKTKMPPAVFLNTDQPDVPSIALSKISELEYDITVTPPAGSEKQWYILYRSETSVIDPDQSELIGLFFGDTAAVIHEAFDGFQNYAGSYKYGATAASRYWIESSVSSVVETDPIPSFPPVVLTSVPAEGDSIAASLPLVLTFSKEMNSSSVGSHFSIEPEAAPVFSWNSDYTVATIRFTNGLQNDTYYTVTLDENVTDVVGLAIDGNGDGTGGDAYILHFKTFGQDVTGPLITGFYPASGEGAFGFDDVMNVEFDEIIDDSTLNDMNVHFGINGSDVTAEAYHLVIDNRSVLSIKTYSQLISDQDYSLNIGTGITDTLGNPMENPFILNIHTANYHYSTKTIMDDFSTSLGWWAPTGSGSTVGVIGSGCSLTFSSNYYLPGSSLSEDGRIGGVMAYQWDPEAATHMYRLHNGGTPATVYLDTTMVLQCYIYGDNSGNEFTFSLYEKDAGGVNTADIIEVRTWVPIDWVGWRLVEWDLSDPTMVGDFLSLDKQMDGHHYLLDGLLLRQPEGAADKGQLYLDNLRVVKTAAGQAPPNSAPVVDTLPNVVSDQGARVRITVVYTDADLADDHQFILFADTSGFVFKALGFASGDRVYIYPPDDLVGDATIFVVVKDFGIGELMDTTSFLLTLTPLSGVGDLLPKQYALHQNYPNPFNAATTIAFELPQNDRVVLSIYNLQGQEVWSMRDVECNAGIHEMSFQLQQLASGIYLYRIQTPSFSDTKRMVIIK